MTRHESPDIFQQHGEPSWEEQEAESPSSPAPTEGSPGENAGEDLQAPVDLSDGLGPLDPAHRLRNPNDNLEGWDIVVGGQTWWIPYDGLFNELDEYRDKLFDASATGGSVRRMLIIEALSHLLGLRYRLRPGEVVSLFLQVSEDELVSACQACLFGVGAARAYTAWAISGLLSVGLDVTSIPNDYMAMVLDHLVLTGRIAKPDVFIDSAIQAARFKSFRSLIKSQAQK